MGNTTSRNEEPSNRRYVYTKRTKAVPTAFVPPERRIIPNGTSISQRVITQEIPKPEIKSDAYPESPSPKQQPDNDKPEPEDKTEPKINGYVKKSKHRKESSDHVVHKEKSYKLYEPEYVIQRDKSHKLYRGKPELVAGRPKSYIHYEHVKPEYEVRERGYKMYEPRYQARRVAHTYGTLRQPEIVTARPVQEVISPRPKSEIITTRSRPVRVVRSVPPMPVNQTVRAQTIGRPVIVRRSIEQERVYTTPEHGYIPRHRLGEYRPKVIDGYVAPSRIGGKVFSDPGGYREVLVEPMYQTVKKIPPPAYPGRRSDREKVPLEKVETLSKRQPGSGKNFILKPHVHKTDDEKLKDTPSTQYFDDGKTLMIIDYLMDPFATKEPPKTVRLEINKNGDILNGVGTNGHVTMNGDQHHNEDIMNENDPNDDSLNSSFNRQRSAPEGDVNFLP